MTKYPVCVILLKGDYMNKISILREKKGITMREAARQLGMPYTTYVNYEKGLREMNSEVLIQMANFFGVTIDYLIGNSINEKTPAEDGERVTEDDIKFALFGGSGDITDDMYNEVKQFAEFVKRREEQKKG